MHDLSFATGIMCLVILLLIFLLKKLHQPYLIAYILAGIILGPHVTGVFRDPESINTIGEFGILLLMFFLGMEVQIPDRKSLLLQPLIAQGTKILVSFIFSAVLCRIMNWPTPTLVLLTAFLTFNSTAVASELMRRNGELTTFFGSIVLNMLLLQDILLAPVITFFQLTGTNEWNATRFIAAILGSASIFFLLRAIRNRNLFQLPFFRLFEKDHELQVFAGACICLGFAMLAELIGLSGPVGSFAAGVFIGRTKAFDWLEEVLHPFRIFFTALFFMSIGIMLDIQNLATNYTMILSATILIMLIHAVSTTVVFRLLKQPWKKSLYAGALLSQTGEFGILLCAIAYDTGMIDEQLYKTGMAVTGLSLLLTTFWEKLNRKLLFNSTLTASLHKKSNNGKELLYIDPPESKRGTANHW
jgi:monovalent cation:H+ antiporter-2, CPA2 family